MTQAFPQVLTRVPCRVVIAALVTLAVAGCGAKRDVARFHRFAETGSHYATVVDSLVAVTGDVSLDVNSEELLRNRALSPVSDSVLTVHDDSQREYLTELLLVRDELRLLGRYFSALSDLADEDVASQVTHHLDEDVRVLNDLSEKLGKSKLIGDEDAATKAAERVGTVVVQHIQRKALRKECEKRKETIARVLSLHEELLQAVLDDLLDNLGRLHTWRYDEKVAAPFLDTGKIKSEAERRAWVRTRRDLLFPAWQAADLERAVGAARELRQAWVVLLAGGRGGATVEGIESDLEAVRHAIRIIRDEIGE